MAAFPKSEFSDWVNHPITKDFLAAVMSVASDHVAELVRRQTVDVNRDQWLRGTIAMADVVASYQPEFVEEQQSAEDAIAAEIVEQGEPDEA